MTNNRKKDNRIGVELAKRLGMTINKTEGHDLVGPCIECKSSDAFRLHQQSGIAQCYSCGGKWSSFQIAEHVLGDREHAKSLFVDLGIFQPSCGATNSADNTNQSDPLEVIAKQKGIKRDSLLAYGAKQNISNSIVMPAYGPDGKSCTTFQMSTKGGKGLFAKGKPAGIFFPHENSKVRLPAPGETWHLVEGPKDAAALHGLGLLACGLNTCRLAIKFARLFVGVDVVLIPDRDTAGEKGAQQSACSLHGVATSVCTAVLPAEFKESDGADVRDILRQTGGEQLVRQAIEDAQPVDQYPGPAGQDEKRQSQATIAANMAFEWNLWHTPSRDAYATIPLSDHNETWPIKSKTFKHYVAKQFFDKQKKAINSEAISTAVNLLGAKALYDGEEHDVHVRVAEYEDNIYIDLCNKEWQVVEVTPSGWQIIDDSPVRFRRSRGMLALPNPERGGSIDQLRGFLNVNDTTWKLIVAWLVSSLRPRGPYPILAFSAEQGAGKSTAARIVRNLLDPNAAPLRTEPRNSQDLMIGANNSWCLAYDNLSNVPPWLSDALCRLSTGGGFATRELYSDQDEVIFNAQRPVLLTSIEEVATRSDLLDRSLVVNLPAIPEENRRREEEIVTSFEKVQPQIFGALLEAISGALRELPNTALAKLPRMADFALWATAAEKALGWDHGDFMAAYKDNRNSANDLAFESSSVGQPLLDFLEHNNGWDGSASELLEAIEQRVSDQTKRAKPWPKNARSMAGHLKRLSPNLRASGWEVDYDRQASQRVWLIYRRDGTPPFMTQPATACDASGMLFDAEPCDSYSYDADDANDANRQFQMAGFEQNGVGYEEGEI